MAKRYKKERKRLSWYTKITVAPPKPFSGANCWFNNLFREKSKKYSWYSNCKKLYPKKPQSAHIRVKMWKCIFRSFDLFQFPFDNKKLYSGITLSVSTRGLSASLSASTSKRTLAGLLSKVSRHKTHYKYKSSISWFLHILLSACVVIMSDGLKLFILFKNLHCDNDSWTIPKLRPFRNFSTNISPLHYFHATLCKPLTIFFVQIANIDFLLTFHFSTGL